MSFVTLIITVYDTVLKYPGSVIILKNFGGG